MAGSVWGLVPCGMVYGALLAALLSGSAVRGALLMLAFGLGTLPNMLALGLSAQWMAGLKGNRVLRRFAGLFIIFFAVAGFLRSGIAADIPLLQLLCLPPQ
jgi:sulfite exporter TauE/SafE